MGNPAKGAPRANTSRQTHTVGKSFACRQLHVPTDLNLLAPPFAGIDTQSLRFLPPSLAKERRCVLLEATPKKVRDRKKLSLSINWFDLLNYFAQFFFQEITL